MDSIFLGSIFLQQSRSIKPMLINDEKFPFSLIILNMNFWTTYDFLHHILCIDNHFLFLIITMKLNVLYSVHKFSLHPWLNKVFLHSTHKDHTSLKYARELEKKENFSSKSDCFGSSWVKIRLMDIPPLKWTCTRCKSLSQWCAENLQ